MATSSKSEPVRVAQLSARRMHTVRTGARNMAMNPAVLRVRRRLQTQQINRAVPQTTQTPADKVTPASHLDTGEQTPDISAIRAEIEDIQRGVQ